MKEIREKEVEKEKEKDEEIEQKANIEPPNAARLMDDHDYYVTENLLALRNTRIGNLMGTCSVTLPTGYPSCGLSLLGLPFKEEQLLRVSAAVEAALAT